MWWLGELKEVSSRVTCPLPPNSGQMQDKLLGEPSKRREKKILMPLCRACGVLPKRMEAGKWCVK